MFIDLCGLVLLPLSVESDGTVDVVTCPLTVDVEWVGPVALFILTDEFGIAVNPDERLAILLGLVVIEGDVHHTGDGVLVSHVGTVVLDNLQVRLIGAFVILVGFVLRQTEARLTHTRDEHQVRIVAHGVTLQFLKTFDDRLGHIEHGVILASQTQHVGQVAGRLGVDGEILGVGGTFGLGDGCLPIELCHAQLVGAVAGVTQPVVGFGLTQFANAVQTVCQCEQFLVISLLIGIHDLPEGSCVTLFRWFAFLAPREGKKRCSDEHQSEKMDSFHIFIHYSFFILKTNSRFRRVRGRTPVPRAGCSPRSVSPSTAGRGYPPSDSRCDSLWVWAIRRCAVRCCRRYGR